MARKFDLMWEFGGQSGSDSSQAPYQVEASPRAVVAVWRYRYPVTFSRHKQASFSNDPNDATRLRDEVLVIVEDVVNLTVSTSKENFISQASLLLLPGCNYLTEIFPGDWIACWIVNNQNDFDSLLKRIKEGGQCNHFKDGLKFLGKTASPRVNISQQPNGLQISGYSLNASGFSELDAGVYFEPYLASNSVGAATNWLQYTGKKFDELMVSGPDGKDPLITVNKAIPFFLDVFFGSGVPKNLGFQDVPPGTDLTKGLDNPNSFIIPDPVGNILGVTRGTKPGGQKGWNDICNVLQGVQNYQLESGTSMLLDTSPSEDPGSLDFAGTIFTPDNVPPSGTTRLLKCNDDLLGSFLPTPPQFNGQRNVWSILDQYVNRTVNEIFMTLRAGPTGAVMPTLVVRQLPFSSNLVDNQYTAKPVPMKAPKDTGFVTHKTIEESQLNPPTRKINLTRFHELPRWVIPPILVKHATFGRSDSMRFNFVHVYGETGLSSQNRTEYIVRDPPTSDDLDILRSGFRPYMATVSCSPNDALNRKAGDWMYIISDIVMGLHLTLTGTMELVGIQSPICIGDNVEFDGHVFHIEAVTHTFNVNTKTGGSFFRTSLNLTHGLKEDQMNATDFSLYGGTSPFDLKNYTAATSRDYSIVKEEPFSSPSQGQETPHVTR